MIETKKEEVASMQTVSSKTPTSGFHGEPLNGTLIIALRDLFKVVQKTNPTFNLKANVLEVSVKGKTYRLNIASVEIC